MQAPDARAEERQRIRASVRRVVVPYLVFAGLWIILSDRALDIMRLDPVLHTHLSIAKGWGFVAITALLLQALLQREIGARERADRALRGFNAELEQRIADRTAELVAATSQAESANRLKSAFLATMSHELRTPLNSITGFTGILLQELPGPVNAEQRKQLGMVRDSARHLLALINDVLDLSKIEAGQLEVRRDPFDAQASIRKAAALVEPLARPKGLDFDVEIAPDIGMLTGDAQRFEQILINLLNNAVKFTERGGVTLTAAIESADAGTPVLRVAVADTGIGIKPDDLQALFQPFRQVDSGLTRQHTGTGLGLAICRRLADLLGGTITVESEPGRGSTFALRLPAAEIEAA